MTTVRATVEVFGTRLGLRAEGEAARLHELARYVDQKMREIADQTASVDTVKIAILTAINIADELFRERDSGPARGWNDGSELRIRQLIKKVEGALTSDEDGKT